MIKDELFHFLKTHSTMAVHNFQNKMLQQNIFARHQISDNSKASLIKSILLTVGFPVPFIDIMADKVPDLHKLQRGLYLDMLSCSAANEGAQK